MTCFKFIIFVALTSTFLCCLNALERKDYEICLDSNSHKRSPGKEDKLHDQCKPWKNYSCCNDNVTRQSHQDKNHYNFNMSHCGRLSDQCKKHFVQDLCFYECEPFVRPWVVQVNRSFARQRILKVPLCASQCQSWWQDCRSDLTCARNWAKDFVWRNNTNVCKKPCQRFEELFSGAEDFCETIWDQSWRYTSDSEPCMKIWFNSTDADPNESTAEWYAKRQTSAGDSTGHNRLTTVSVGLLLWAATALLEVDVLI